MNGPWQQLGNAIEPWWTGTSARHLECSVLGSILILGDVLPKVRSVMGRNDFMADAHRLIFDAMLDVEKSGAIPDLVLVAHQLERNGTMERAGGAAYLSMLVDRVPCVDSAGEYAKRVKECSAIRRAEGGQHP